ncbi:MAG: hypothetical protein NT099_01035 [Candidatus Saganbacteria bacterium]|nr:hypothetical protein [Candidatus Saganbacteria bacterium]
MKKALIFLFLFSAMVLGLALVSMASIPQASTIPNSAGANVPAIIAATSYKLTVNNYEWKINYYPELTAADAQNLMRTSCDVTLKKTGVTTYTVKILDGAGKQVITYGNTPFTVKLPGGQYVVDFGGYGNRTKAVNLTKDQEVFWEGPNPVAVLQEAANRYNVYKNKVMVLEQAASTYYNKTMGELKAEKATVGAIKFGTNLLWVGSALDNVKGDLYSSDNEVQNKTYGFVLARANIHTAVLTKIKNFILGQIATTPDTIKNTQGKTIPNPALNEKPFLKANTCTGPTYLSTAIKADFEGMIDSCPKIYTNY